MKNKELIAQELKELNEKHPFYHAKTSLLVFLKHKPAVIFTHSWGGGAHDFIFEYLCDRIGSEYILLIAGSGDLGNNIKFLKNKNILHEVTIKEFSQILALLDNAGASSFHLNHLISFDNILLSVDLLTSFLEKQQAKIFFYLHDYFSLCPTVNLLNHQNIYCGLPSDIFACNQCLSKINNLFDFRLVKNVSIQAWRSSFLNLLRVTNEIYSFSASSSRILRMAFPEIAFKISHYQLRTPNLASCQQAVDFSHKRRLQLGVLGAIGPHKGLEILQYISLLIDKLSLPIDITIIGYAAKRIYGVRETGEYNKNDLSGIIKANEIDCFFLPSICPETYCYTADEVMALGYPIICFNLGAPAERIAKYTHGYLVDNMSAQAVLEKTMEVAGKYGFERTVKRKIILSFYKCMIFYFFYLTFSIRKACVSFLKPIAKKILRSYGIIKIIKITVKGKRRLGKLF